ncbi:GNAT family N-acetyltransferase [Bosea sp. 685]|uniref:GNAT family N-acetyltransferase n=1 Tax=Bosea sp. 685 TaxID=3080057 RepID=UPI002892A9EA|nr:GNAT family N-acetyltransferase [Bosea sp. 685]WNJ92070.1 GNAT family N-acetyltransferase [Bosea sp. 685]
MHGQSIPRLTTPRLTLRAQIPGDFPAYAKFLASPRAKAMGGPYRLRDAWGLFCHDIAGWALFGHGALMIELAGTGECIGQVGINDGPLFPERELGWLVYDGHEGKGYATEAALALRDWAADTAGLRDLVSYIDQENHRSIAVVERLGAVLDRDARKPDPEDLVYRHHMMG